MGRTFIATVLAVTMLGGAAAAETPVFDILSRIKTLQQDRTCRNATENALNGEFNPAQLSLDTRQCQTRFSFGGAQTFVGPPKTISTKGTVIPGELKFAINGCNVEAVGKDLIRLEQLIEQELHHQWWYIHQILTKTSKLAADLQAGLQPTENAALTAADREAAIDYLKRTGLIGIDGTSQRALQLVREKVLDEFGIWLELLDEKEVIYSSLITEIELGWKTVTRLPNCPPVTTSGVAEKKPKENPKPPAGSNPPPPKSETAGNPENDVVEKVPDSPGFTYKFGLGGRYVRAPDLQLGIQSFNVNFNPLHDFNIDLYGPVIFGEINLGPTGPFDTNEGWVGSVNGEYARLFGDENDTISAFSPGQLPTYIDITGTGGFGFNNNSRIDVDLDRDAFRFGAELGYKAQYSDNLFLRPYGRLQYRHSKNEANIGLETDFLGGTFFNTLNEEIRENQFGGAFGLEVTQLTAPNMAWTFGGHLGGMFTNANYRGSDCGDGSTATPGCDGALFLNPGIATGNSSFDVFGGLKAALGLYVFCRDKKLDLIAGAINAAVDHLKKNCVEISASAAYDAIPTADVSRPTAIGVGQQTRLGTGYSHSASFQIGVRFHLSDGF